MAWLGKSSEGGGAEGELPNAGEYASGTKIPGTQLKVIQVLGRGGHATVYEVENVIGKRLVAKVIHAHLASRGDFASRIEAEARTLVLLEHVNIVAVHDLGITADGRPLIVMERLTGKSGREILQEVGRLEVQNAIDIGIDVCSALATAHSKKVVHQDIKPDNIFIHIGLDGRPVTKLVDFGIMRMLDKPQEEGVFEGTVLYAAPEQLRFEPVTPKADLYAVGLLLFELLTGVRPFPDLADAPNAAAAVKTRLAHLAKPAPSLSRWLLVPAQLEILVHQCLAVSPDERPESAAKLGAALRTLKNKLASAPRDAQLRTESTLLGAVAGPAPRAMPSPQTATAGVDPFAAAAGVGRFGLANNDQARIAKGVLTAEHVQSGATARLSTRPEARGRFADALAAGSTQGDRPSDAPTSVPPESAPSLDDAAGTLDPTVPSHAEEPSTRRGRRGVLTLAVAVTLTLVVAVASVGWLRHRAPRADVAESPTPTAAAMAAPPVASASAPPPPAPSAIEPASVPSAAPALVASAAAPVVAEASSSAPSASPSGSPPAARRVSAPPHATSPGRAPSTSKSRDPMASWLEQDAPPPPPPTARAKPAPAPASKDKLESF